MHGRISLTAAMALASAVFVAPAAAHETASVDARIDQALANAPAGRFVQIKTLGPTRRAADGLLEIRLPDGEIVETHGPDPEPPAKVAAADAAFSRSGASTAPACRACRCSTCIPPTDRTGSRSRCTSASGPICAR